MDTQGNDGKGKTRVAVLGSGPAAMAAVWGLLQSAKAEQYEISIYQLGWRIGGKCATGRNAALGSRAEEHGLHIWSGMYENGFQMIRGVYAALRQMQYSDEMSNAEFDTMCFGEAPAPRALDPRVVRAIATIARFSGEPVTAAACAAEAGLSPSRFLHLFKEETGTSFRSFRAWRRARHLLHFANQDINLAHLAQDIGYPDSTHFSHSIRRFYGLKPRAIFSGSRDLAIYHRHAVS